MLVLFLLQRNQYINLKYKFHIFVFISVWCSINFLIFQLLIIHLSFTYNARCVCYSTFIRCALCIWCHLLHNRNALSSETTTFWSPVIFDGTKLRGQTYLPRIEIIFSFFKFIPLTSYMLCSIFIARDDFLKKNML